MSNTVNSSEVKQCFSFVLKSPAPGMGGWGNGYVAIPEGHPMYGVDYDEIHRRYSIEINGGLTYSDTANDNHPEEAAGMWVVGFDTLHYGDNAISWPNEASVKKEADKLLEQCNNLVFTEEWEMQNKKQLAYQNTYGVNINPEAVPELLEACKAAQDYLYTKYPKEADIFKQLSAAIQKAEL